MLVSVCFVYIILEQVFREFGSSGLGEKPPDRAAPAGGNLALGLSRPLRRQYELKKRLGQHCLVAGSLGFDQDTGLALTIVIKDQLAAIFWIRQLRPKTALRGIVRINKLFDVVLVIKVFIPTSPKFVRSWFRAEFRLIITRIFAGFRRLEIVLLDMDLLADNPSHLPAQIVVKNAIRMKGRRENRDSAGPYFLGNGESRVLVRPTIMKIGPPRHLAFRNISAGRRRVEQRTNGDSGRPRDAGGESGNIGRARLQPLFRHRLKFFAHGRPFTAFFPVTGGDPRFVLVITFPEAAARQRIEFEPRQNLVGRNAIRHEPVSHEQPACGLLRFRELG